MAFRLRCPICRGAFSFDPKVEQWPDFCRLKECGARIGMRDRADDDICMPSIRTARSVATDKVYRDMERGSEVRAQAAAEMAGTSVEDMSSLKITDLNSTRHEGDVAAPAVTAQNNQVLAFMQNNGVGGFMGNGAEYSTAVQSGAGANAGARMMTNLRSTHQDMVRTHAVGFDPLLKRAVIPSTDVLSERPATQTQDPGYRRRG